MFLIDFIYHLAIINTLNLEVTVAGSIGFKSIISKEVKAKHQLNVWIYGVFQYYYEPNSMYVNSISEQD